MLQNRVSRCVYVRKLILLLATILYVRHECGHLVVQVTTKAINKNAFFAHKPKKFTELDHPSIIMSTEVARYSAAVKNSFAYNTTIQRWPSILTQVIDGLFQRCHALSANGTSSNAKVNEAKSIIEQISQLKYELTHNKALKPINVTSTNAPRIGSFHAPTTEPYDDIIRRCELTWFQSDWLFTECYLYRRLRHLFEVSNEWKEYDPFITLKNDSFRVSGRGVHACATWMEDVLFKSETHDAAKPFTKKLFKDIVYSSLWGNVSDLSLLLNITDGELQKRQSTSEKERATKAQHIILNDINALWNKVRCINEGRVDFVLDNTGFELVTDFLLADFMLTLRGPIACASEERARDIETRIHSVRERISEASKVASRDKAPSLLVVSKLHPPSDLMAAYHKTGQRHFGENYVQELVDKASVLPDDIRWHFIGGLQSNKAKLLATVSNLFAVESVDSEKLATALEKALAKPENAALRTYPLYVYIQVNTSGEEGKSGVPAMLVPWQNDAPKPPLLALAQKIILECPHMRLQGLMTIGAMSNSQASQESNENPDFATLVSSRQHLTNALRQDVNFQTKLSETTWWTPNGHATSVYDEMIKSQDLGLSMGMSADMQAAITMGSTNVRIGSDCFGRRTSNNEAAIIRADELEEWSKRPLVKEVVFHTKNMPWFVSDTCVPDVWRVLDQLSQPDFFSCADSLTMEPIHRMAMRWRSHFEERRFRLAMPHDTPLGASVDTSSDYWTWPDSYETMPNRAPELFRELQTSDLVVFKGDLNYRKLTQDAQWPTSTSFSHTLGPLAGKVPLVVLRTCKAEVCVGLHQAQVAELDQCDATWRTNGNWAGTHLFSSAPYLRASDSVCCLYPIIMCID